MHPFLTITDINKFTSYEFETACRTYCSYAKLKGNIGVTRVLTRYKIFVDLNDISLVPHLILDGFWETPVTQCLSRIVKEGDVCIDVGAHLGYFSILMSALAGGRGRTLAVEPNPVIASLLRKTSEINYPGFIMWEGVLSNRKGELEIYVPAEKSGNSSLLMRNGSGENELSKYRVPGTTMDLLAEAQSFNKIDVIKIDAEGAEPLIFEGMENVLKRNRDLKIVMEYSPYLYTDRRKFNKFLLSRFDLYRISSGFGLEKVENRQLEEWSMSPSHFDLLLLPQDSDLPSDLPGQGPEA